MLAAAEVPFTYRRSGLEGRIVLETVVRLRPEPQGRLDEQIAEMFEWRQRGTPFNQPCCGSVFKNPSGPSWKREGGPRTAGQLIEAAGLKGTRDRRRPGLADARELLREHRRGHGRRRARG